MSIGDLLFGPKFSGTVLTYSLNSANSKWDGSVDQAADDWNNKYDLSTAWKIDARKAMLLWSNYSPLQITEETGSADANIYAFRADFNNGDSGGTAWFDDIDSGSTYTSFSSSYERSEFGFDNSAISTYDSNSHYRQYILLHEIAHSLGIKGDVPISNSYTTDQTVASYDIVGSGYSYDPTTNAITYSISNLDDWRFAVTPMAYDIAALESLYEASYVYNDCDVYDKTWFQTEFGFDGTKKLSMTIADAGNAVDTTPGGGQDTISFAGISGDHRIDLREAIDGQDNWMDARSIMNGQRKSNGDLDDGHEYIYIARGTKIENATGGNGHDVIIGNDENNKLLAGGGNDTVYGGINIDAISGGDGSDWLIGGGNQDLILGGAGNDNLFGDQVVSSSYWEQHVSQTNRSIMQDGGADGDDLLIGGTGDDSIYGAGGNDIIFGGKAPDAILPGGLQGLPDAGGNDGANTLIGGSGEDTFYGGDRNDTIYGSTTSTHIEDGYTDTVNYSLSTTGIIYTLGSATTGVALVDVGTSTSNQDKLYSIEDLVGSDHEDKFSFHELNGRMTINGGAGLDVADYSPISDDENFIRHYIAETGTAPHTSENQIVSTLRSIEHITGASSNDVFLLGDFKDGITIDGGDGEDNTLENADLQEVMTVDVEEGELALGSLSLSFENIQHFIGGNQNDTMIGDAEVQIFEGGKGNDSFVGGGSDTYVFDDFKSGELGTDTIIGGDADSKLIIDGKHVYGIGDQFEGMPYSILGPEHEYYTLHGYSGYRLHYTAETSTLTIQNGENADSRIIIEDWQSGDFGISLYTFNPDSLAHYVFDFLSEYYGEDLTESEEKIDLTSYMTPLALDLDGDGIELDAVQYYNQFDIDNDGLAEFTGWVSADDGLLVVDSNANGVIDNVGEMFGAGNGTSAWDKLATYDSNQDGVVDAQDSNWSDLLIWKDANGDKVTDAGELVSLESLGVHGIETTHDSYYNDDPLETNGNIVDGSAAWLDEYGVENGRVYDVYFDTIQNGATYVGDDLTQTPELDVANLLMPNLKGRGDVKALYYALGENQDLHALVSGLSALEMGAADSAVSAVIEDILIEWTETGGVATNSRGSLVNGQHVAILEKLLGINHDSGALTPNLPSWSVEVLDTTQAAEFGAAWDGFFNQTKVVLQVQSSHAELFPDASYSFLTGQIAFNGSVEAVMTAAMAVAPTTSPEQSDYWNGIYNILKTGEDTGSLTLNENSRFSVQDLHIAVQAAAGESVTIAEPNLGSVISGTEAIEALTGTSGIDVFKISALHHSLHTAYASDVIYDFDPAQDKLDVQGLGFERLIGEAEETASEGELRIEYDAYADMTYIINDQQNFALAIAGEVALHDDHFVYGSVIRGTENADTLLGGNASDLLLGDAGDDAITGGNEADTLEGGAGADTLTGGDGADSFRYTDITHSIGTGDAYDILEDFTVGGDKIDLRELPFSSLTTNGTTQTGELRLEYDSNTDLTFLRSDQSDFVIALRGDQTSTFSASDIMFREAAAVSVGAAGYFNDTASGGAGQNALEGLSGHDTLIGNVDEDFISGGTGHDVIEGGGGNDILTGGSGDDELIGGAGNDILRGGEGSDIYYYNAGDGDDVIIGAEDYESRVDEIHFGAGITIEDISTSQIGENLLLSINGGGSITVAQFYEVYPPAIGRLTFADGSMIAVNDLLSPAPILQGTSGDDILSGENYVHDVIDGLAGADTLTGGYGDDTFVFSDASHSVATNDAYDRITDFDAYDGDLLDVSGAGFTAFTYNTTTQAGELRAEYDSNTDRTYVLSDQSDFAFYLDGDWSYDLWEGNFIFAGASGDTVTGTSGYDWIEGTDSADVLDGAGDGDDIYGYEGDDAITGGTGDDYLYGGEGSDSYHYASGDGHDTISDSNGYDALIFAAGIDAEDVFFEREYDDLKITIASGGSITVQSHFTDPDGYNDYALDRILFDDGTQLSMQDITRAITVNDQHIIIKGDTADTVAGGIGNDTLEAGAGDDTYLYAAGDGSDTISDAGGASDTLQFDTGITYNDLAFAREYADLRINVNNESILLSGQFTDPLMGQGQIETVAYDGGSITAAQIRDLLLTSTSGDDVLQGYYTDDTIEGGLGNDTMQGEAGDDAFIYNLGDGDDQISDESGNDTLQFAGSITLNDLSFSKTGYEDLRINVGSGSVTIASYFAAYGAAIETITYNGGSLVVADVKDILLTSTSGDDSIVGFASDDTLEGGLGNDTLEGAAGSDTYIYNSGDGNDVIYDDNAYQEDTDTLVLGAGITTNDVTFKQSGTNLEIELAGGGSITVQGHFYDDYGSFPYLLEEVHFADSTVLTAQDIEALLVPSDDAEINGTSGADTLDGGIGNDTLYGGYGNDTYVYESGDGNDVIYDDGDVDTLQFGTGIGLNDLSFTDLNGSDLQIDVAGGGSVVIQYQFDSYSMIETIGYDGGSLSEGDIRTMLLDAQATSGDDYIYGYFGFDNTIAGGYGNDELYGDYSGNDLLLGENGDDYLYGYDGENTLNGGAGSDYLEGGWDQDTFQFSDLTHSVATGNAYDTIADFEQYWDLLDVSGLGFSSFTSNGTTAAGELKAYYDSGNDLTFVASDQNDFTFAMQGDYASYLSDYDFIFS